MSILSHLFGPPVPGTSARDVYARLLAANAPFVLDVREPDEYRTGYIAGSVLIPSGELPRRLAEISRDREIVVVCESGMRSRSATRKLIAAGFRAVDLRGGMNAWRRAGLPVQRDSNRS